MTRRILGHLAVTLLTVTALLGAALPAAAITAATQNDLIEIDLPSFRHEAARTYSADIGRLETARALEARYGAKWAVYSWNGLSGTPRHVYGRSVQLTGSLRSADAVESLARQVIVDNYDVLKADVDNLRLHSTPHALGKWVAHFQQTYQGIDVWEARVRVALSDAGKLIVMGSDYYDDIDLNANPTISAGTAIAIATGDLAFNPAKDRVEASPELLVLPVPQSATEVEHHLVWRLTVRTESPLGAWMTHVDAHSGEILWRYNNVHFAFEGDTETDAQVYGICDGVTAKPMPYVNMEVQGVGSATTDANGEWYIAGGGASGTVGATLYGPYIDMNNYGGAEAAFSGTATAGVPFTIDWDDSNSRQDERTSFDAINQVHDFFELFAPGFGYSNTRINCYVNRSDGYCPGNAWWNGTINFCAAGSGFANTGELQGVVHHEFGHGVQWSILGSQGNEGLGEGNSDILLNLMCLESIIGRGFYEGNCLGGIRDSDNILQYPEDLNGSVHHDGQIIAGFHWDFWEQMEAAYGTEQARILCGERWHYGRVLEEPWYQPDQVLATFIADDDDGDLDNGTPHHEYLCEAAMNHGFECPPILLSGVYISHTPVASHDEVGDVDVVARILSYNAPLIPEEILLNYQVNGGLVEQVIMTPTGNLDEFVGVIPNLQQPSEVGYFIEARDTDDNYASHPEDAPATLHMFVVAPKVDIVAEDVESGSPDWTHEAASGGFNDEWHISTERNRTPGGESSWKCGDTGTGDYGDLLDAALMTPVFDLLPYARLTFWQWMETDTSTAYPAYAYDGGIVELSLDGGPFMQIFPEEGYTHLIRHGINPGPFPEGLMVFAGSRDWHQIHFDLSTYEGDAQIRFRFGTDYGGNREGWYIDDVLIEGFQFGFSGVEDQITKRVLHLSSADPNPFLARTTIHYALPTQADVTLQVFDLSGRVVRTLMRESQPAGNYRVEWDGRDDAARHLPAGVYLARLKSDEETVSSKIILAE